MDKTQITVFPLQFSEKDRAFQQAQEATVQEICQVYSISEQMLGTTTNHTNAQEDRATMWRFLHDVVVGVVQRRGDRLYAAWRKQRRLRRKKQGR